MGKQGDVYPTWFWVSYIFKGTWKIRKWGNTSPICLHLLFFYTRLYIWTSSLYRRFVSAGPNLSRLVVEPRENTTQITYIHVYIYIYISSLAHSSSVASKKLLFVAYYRVNSCKTESNWRLTNRPSTSANVKEQCAIENGPFTHWVCWFTHWK